MSLSASSRIRISHTEVLRPRMKGLRLADEGSLLHGTDEVDFHLHRHQLRADRMAHEAAHAADGVGQRRKCAAVDDPEGLMQPRLHGHRDAGEALRRFEHLETQEVVEVPLPAGLKTPARPLLSSMSDSSIITLERAPARRVESQAREESYMKEIFSNPED